jgi:membrane-bound inhibitor of C-type lysozyme
MPIAIMPRLAPALVAAAAAAAPAFAEDVPEGMTVSYACDGGGALTIAYINPADSTESFAVVLHDGELVAMKAGPTGSGVRYVSIGEPKLVWHTKGNAGFLARDDAEETMILQDCNEAE